MRSPGQVLRCWPPVVLAAGVLGLAASAGAQTVRLRSIAPDADRGTAAAVVVEAGGLAHTALVFPEDAAGVLVAPGDAASQTTHVLDGLTRVLGAAGTDLAHLVRLHVYVADASVVPAVDRVLAARPRGASLPALTLVETRMPRPGVLVAMDAVAATAQHPAPGAVQRLVVAGLPAGVNNDTQVTMQPDGPFAIVSGRAAPGDFEVAVRGTLEQLRADLAGIGLDFSHVVHVKSFLSDMTRATDLQRLVAGSFAGTPPPQVVTEWRGASLPVEIELVAVAPAAPIGTERVTFVEPIASRFSRVARVAGGRPVYVSGLVGSAADPVVQVREIFTDLSRVLAAAGSDLRHLAKATYYVSDQGADQEINVVRPTLFDANRPPAASKISVQGVGRPGKGSTIDIIAITTDR